MKNIKVPQNNGESAKNFLNDSDFFFSKYKAANIQEVTTMLKAEIQELMKQQQQIDKMSQNIKMNEDQKQDGGE